jgi:hypothetical protein
MAGPGFDRGFDSCRLLGEENAKAQGYSAASRNQSAASELKIWVMSRNRGVEGKEKGDLKL